MGDLALVTGATGFVGAAVARTLQGAGFTVRVTSRPGSDQRNLAALNAQVVPLDLAEPASFAPALAGCRYLFHVAADYRLWVPDEAAMRRVNVDGTSALLRAAAAAGVERTVYTSSVAALGLTADGSPADEHTPILPAHHAGAYKQSKYDAEQAVRALAAGGQDVVIVNPSTPVGPGDVKPTPTGQMILDAARGKMPAYVDTGLNLVHVDDVAQGHLLALQKGISGQAYILGAENMMLGDIFRHSRGPGRAPPAADAPAHCPARTNCLGDGANCRANRQNPADDPRRAENGAQENVLLLRPRPAGTRLRPAPGSIGHTRRARLVPQGGLATVIILLAFLTWLYLVFLHGKFWVSGPELKPAQPLTTPDVDIIVPARDEADVDRPRHRLASGAGLPGQFPRHTGRRQFHRRYGARGGCRIRA